MEKTKLSQKEIDYIKDNRLNMSMNQMASNLKASFYQVSSYMKKNNLMVDKKTIYKIRTSNHYSPNPKRAECYQKEQWLFDIWNHRINPVTMYKV